MSAKDETAYICTGSGHKHRHTQYMQIETYTHTHIIVMRQIMERARETNKNSEKYTSKLSSPPQQGSWSYIKVIASGNRATLPLWSRENLFGNEIEILFVPLIQRPFFCTLSMIYCFSFHNTL